MKLFNFQHLEQVEETYFEHFKFSIWAGIFLLYLAIISLIHAVLPFLFSRYPDRLFHKFVDLSAKRRNRVDAILQSKKIE